MRRSKYGARRTNGFSSALENAVHLILKERESLGEITDIKCQHTIVLQTGDKKTIIRWKVDFSFTNTQTGLTELCEAKGVETDSYKLKLRIYRKHSPYRLTIYKGTWQRPIIAEVIESKSFE